MPDAPDALRSLAPIRLLDAVCADLPDPTPGVQVVVVLDPWAWCILEQFIKVNGPASERLKRHPFTMVPGEVPVGKLFEVTVRAG